MLKSLPGGNRKISAILSGFQIKFVYRMYFSFFLTGLIQNYKYVRNSVI